MLDTNFVNKIVKKYSLTLFLLFGSRANQTNRSDSDYDLAFESSEKFDSEYFFDLMDELEIHLKKKVDLINLKKQDDPLLNNNIAKNSILIFEKEEGIYDNYVVNSIFNYIDYSPLYKIEEEIVNQKLLKL